LNLLFLYNELLNPSRQRELRIPMDFVSFAYIKGNLYRHFRNESTFILPNAKRVWGNHMVYGALFHIKDFSFYIELLDRYHQCSLSSLMRNHNFDIHHRESTCATPIHFNTLDEMGRLIYRESEPIQSYVYFGNPNHPKIKQRLGINNNSYRILDGVDKIYFKKLYEEEKYDTKN
jgi:hypothetical protein